MSESPRCVPTDQKVGEIADIQCGIGKWRPQFLKIFNNPYAFCVFLSMYAFLHGFVTDGAHHANTTSYERRFHLKSEDIGWISSTSEIIAAILSVALGFFGAKNKVRWIAFGAFLFILGCVLMGLPHFTTGRYEWGQSDERFCSATPRQCDQDDSKETSGLQKYFWMLLVGYVLLGVSSVTIMIIGMSAIDDMFPPQTSPLYTGIVHMSLYVGLGAGYIVGGQALNLYTDFDQLSDNEWSITQHDSRWIGAWWLCLFCAAALCLVFFFVFSLYGGSSLSVKKTETNKMNNEVEQRTITTQDSSVSTAVTEVSASEAVRKPSSLKEFSRIMRRVLRMPMFLSLSFGYTATFSLIVGSAIFFPKVVQNQYVTTSAWSAFYSGVVIIPAAGIGQFVGGLLVKKLKLEVRGCVILAVALKIISVPAFFIYLVYCQQQNIAGWNAGYDNSSTVRPFHSHLFDSNCNSGCNCDLANYEPVCNSNGLQFFSPCHAGCSAVDLEDVAIFTNCTCAALTSEMDKVSSCEQGCNLVYSFLIVSFAWILLVSALFIPTQTAIFRIVGDKDKTLAIGVTWFLVRIFGSTPGPIVMGAVIDVACVVWGEKCGARKSCWIFDNGTLARNLTLLTICIASFGAIMYILAYVFYVREKRRAFQYKIPEDVNKAMNTNDTEHFAREIRGVPESMNGIYVDNKDSADLYNTCITHL